MLQFFAQVLKGFQHLLDICSSFGFDYDVSFNSIKSVIMIFTFKPLGCQVPIFLLMSKVLPVVEKFKYLGHIFDNYLRDNLDIERQIKFIYTKCNVLIHKVKFCDTTVKVKLFKTFCCSFYTSELWCTYSKVIIRKLIIAYGNIFKKVLNMSRYEQFFSCCSL